MHGRFAEREGALFLGLCKPASRGREIKTTVMAVVVVNDVQVLNPTGAAFTDNFQFEITFECTAELKEDIEWKVVYVGSAEDQNHDQELEAIMVGPLPVGKSSNYHIYI